jgi:hypothetical protein
MHRIPDDAVLLDSAASAKVEVWAAKAASKIPLPDLAPGETHVIQVGQLFLKLTGVDETEFGRKPLGERVDERIREEWPGTPVFRDGRLYTPPAVREGGATDALLKRLARIIEQEVAR